MLDRRKDTLFNFFDAISLTQSEILNVLLRAVLFEVTLFLAVPLVGIIVNSVIVNGIRGAFSTILGRKGEFILSNYIMFIGVVIHELSHALFALITGAKVKEVALFKPEGNSLGHVIICPRGNTFTKALQSSFSACAPVAVGLVICYFVITKIFPIISLKWHYVVTFYVLLSVLFHMNMSKPDLKAYFSGTLSLLLVFLPISIIYFAV